MKPKVLAIVGTPTRQERVTSSQDAVTVRVRPANDAGNYLEVEMRPDGRAWVTLRDQHGREVAMLYEGNVLVIEAGDHGAGLAAAMRKGGPFG